jgi:hypothetical protein
MNLKAIKPYMIASAVVVCLAIAPLAAQPQIEDASEGTRLTEDLLDATVTACQLEIERYQIRLAAAEKTGDGEKAAQWKKDIEDLRQELARLQAMTPAEYPAGAGSVIPGRPGPFIPAVKEEISVTVKNGYSFGALLDLDNATRSGPFYHLAGIRGGCTCVLKAGRQYKMTVYLVYRREYFGNILDCYVYVAEYQK